MRRDKYYAIKAYQILDNISDEEVAKHLGITVRTLQNKRKGRTDFTLQEGNKLSELLNRPKSEIFLTK